MGGYKSNFNPSRMFMQTVISWVWPLDQRGWGVGGVSETLIGKDHNSLYKTDTGCVAT